MRMWMVDPRIMCKNHLLGEHLETHMFHGVIKKGLVSSLKGYVENNLLEIESLKKRHDELAQEIVRRKYRHTSYMEPLNEDLVRNIPKVKINVEESLKELLSRCPKCRERYKQIYDAKF
jgi:SMC interacting uncharacterized protein involved in chromosome segregation